MTTLNKELVKTIRGLSWRKVAPYDRENKEGPLESDLSKTAKYLYLPSIEKESHLVSERDAEFGMSDVDRAVEIKSEPTSRNQVSSRTLDG